MYSQNKERIHIMEKYTDNVIQTTPNNKYYRQLQKIKGTNYLSTG